MEAIDLLGSVCLSVYIHVNIQYSNWKWHWSGNSEPSIISAICFIDVKVRIGRHYLLMVDCQNNAFVSHPSVLGPNLGVLFVDLVDNLLSSPITYKERLSGCLIAVVM